MNQEQGRIDKFKPSAWLYIFLFIYYSAWVISAIGTILSFAKSGMEMIEGCGIKEYASGVVMLLAALYCLYAVIKTLRGDRDCITSLKWSVIMCLLYSLMNPTRVSGGMSDSPFHSILYFSLPTLYLIFYLYLSFSKGIKRRYPKPDRRFRPSGYVWLGILGLMMIVGGYSVYIEMKEARHCRCADLYDLPLKAGVMSDGYVMFKTAEDWEWYARFETADTLWKSDQIETLPTIMSSDSTSLVYISSGRCYNQPERSYNWVLTRIPYMLKESYGREVLDKIDISKIRELSHLDTVVRGNRMLSTGFEVKIDSVMRYVRISMICEKGHTKCVVLTRIDKEKDSQKWEIEMARSIRFDLQEIAERHNDKNDNKEHHQHTDGVPEDDYSPLEAMDDTLAYSLTPRESACIASLQQDKGEVAKCEEKQIFYDQHYHKAKL
ncbi:MAG: hypothetical protein ACI304_01185 [Lepagella sp.]